MESDHNITINWDNTATYTHSYGLHNFSLLVGTNLQNEDGHGLNGNFYGEPVNSFSQASANFMTVCGLRSARRGAPYSFAVSI
ncbi:hypothetical protein [Mucilaginibacter sp. BT774]|uniref:hypothetical protein n=1 Tax=Mucilaginibacter sp. BT774 TaxID=3062276 RepID=UPI002675614F|nr:hypothetical protein [Mucilaginibacter sp. BT774]MDO3627619.1 hypothetical protein [Mucilaginibacter sp. BT774]